MSSKLRMCVVIGITMIVGREGQAGAQVSFDGAGEEKITVRFFNYAPVPAKILDEARERVTAIYHRAGIAIDWIECPGGNQDPSGFPACSDDVWDATHLSLHLLPQASKTIKAEIVAESLLGARMASIYWNRVRQQAESVQAKLDRVLAHTIAHEVGHLLLGSNSHSPTGIMVGKWNRQDLVSISQFGLGFTTQQSEFIRAEVQRRRSTQSASR